MKEQIKQLYKTCFDDSETFVEYYFQHRYTDSRNLCIERNGMPVAALQTLFYPMTFGGNLCATSYLSAVCTHPNYRNQGLMRDLLTHTHQSLAARGVWASMLIPAESWLFDVYAKQQYTTIFYKETELITIDQLAAESTCVVEKLIPECLSEVFAFFNEKMLERAYGVMHTEDDFKTLVGALALEHGYVLVASTAEQLSGVAFVHPSGKVLDIVYNSNLERATLLRTAGQHCQIHEILCFVAPTTGRKQPLGMMRVISAEKFLKMYAAMHYDCTKTMCLIDDELPENNGCYTLSQGLCVKTEVMNQDNLWNMSQLATFLFQDINPYMSLMMDE